MHTAGNSSERILATTNHNPQQDRPLTFRQMRLLRQAERKAAAQTGVAEALEDRRHFAVTANLSGGTLTVTGTINSEEIAIGQRVSQCARGASRFQP